MKDFRGALKMRGKILTMGLALMMALAPSAAWAQAKASKRAVPATYNDPNQDKAMALRPPAGSKVAIIVFEDLECPDCARAAPLVQEVSKSEKVPIVRHDFPLPMHPWAFDAAVFGRYFDTKSKKLGDGWREYVFNHQPSISAENLTQTAQEYAKANNVALPFLLDPGGKLAEKVKADFRLGQKIGIIHTPTIFVVSNKKKGDPFVEVVDRSQMTQMVEDMKKSAQ
jgi:protein-disulfide isomerase